MGSEDLDARAWVAYLAVWGVAPSLVYYSQPSEEAMQRYRNQTSSSSGDGCTYVDFGNSCSSHGDGGSCGGSDGSDGGGDGGGGCGGGCGGA